MSNEWEEKLRSLAQGPGKTEKEKCDNAELGIKKAIYAHPILSEMDISVFAQGSYKARTNIRLDSDVDICVRMNSTLFCDYPVGKSSNDYDLIDGDMQFSEFKSLVQEALVDRFGSKSITRGDKALDVHANSYRIDADVVPTYEYRMYYSNSKSDYNAGIAFKTDKGNLIKNWPLQTYENGVQKNEATSKRYKRVIRILKNLRNKMQEEQIVAANNIPSFLIECLVWNVPNEGFCHNLYVDDVRYVIAHTFNETLNDDKCKKWHEVNKLKYLFSDNQSWTPKQSNSFLSATWDYLNFE